MKRVGITDIAKAAEVSPSTVSRVLNGNPRISQEVTDRVLRIAREMGYLMHTAGTKVIALISTYTDVYYVNVLSALRRVAMERGYRLELFLPETQGKLNEKLYCGGILFGAEPQILNNFPLVTINDKQKYFDGCYSIVSDDEDATEKSILRFMENGHRKIGFLLSGDLSRYNNRIRQQAYRTVCRKYGLQTYEEYTNSAHDDLQGAILRLYKRGITALIYQVIPVENPQTLFAKLGIRIPLDLSLIAWEMLGCANGWCPDYIIADQDYQAIAACAITTVEKLSAKESVPWVQKVPYRFRLGNSIRNLRSK